MSNEIVPAAKRKADIAAWIQSPEVKERFAMALPRVGLTPDRFARMALTAFSRQPQLLECTRASLMGCLVQAAESGLSPSGVSGEAYLVPFRNKGVLEAQFIPGYRGLMKLARRSGEVRAIMAEVVREGDDFTYALGIDHTLRHTPRGDDDKAITHAYAYAHLKDGGFQFSVLTRIAVDKIRDSSRASSKGPWVTHYPEMAKKSAIKRLCKLLPISDDDARLLDLADREERGIAQRLNFDHSTGEILDAPEDESAITVEVASTAKPAADTRPAFLELYADAVSKTSTADVAGALARALGHDIAGPGDVLQPELPAATAALDALLDG